MCFLLQQKTDKEKSQEIELLSLRWGNIYLDINWSCYRLCQHFLFILSLLCVKTLRVKTWKSISFWNSLPIKMLFKTNCNALMSFQFEDYWQRECGCSIEGRSSRKLQSNQHWKCFLKQRFSNPGRHRPNLAKLRTYFKGAAVVAAWDSRTWGKF